MVKKEPMRRQCVPVFIIDELVVFTLDGLVWFDEVKGADSNIAQDILVFFE